DALRQPAPGPPAGPGAPPETWAPLAPGQDWQQVPVAVEERGFRLIYGLLHKSLPEARCRLERARRVQSPFLWDKYKRKQSHMSRQTSPEQRLRNERHLFHGTSAGAVPAFCKHNLDPRLPGEHAALYGQGSYFARRASYSHRYAPPAEAGLRHGSLCKVLVGRSGLGQPAPAPGRRRPGQRPVRLVRGQPERPPDLRGLRRRPVLPLLPAPVPPAGGGGEGGL
ncbi:unnamed protein product, partial [Caretta caretta]